MEIDNKKSTARAKLMLVRLPLLLFLVILVLTLMEVFDSSLWLIISVSIFILTLLVVIVGRLHFVNISIGQSEILIKFYHLFPLITDYQEILIQLSDKPNFEIRKSFFGLVPILIISLNTSRGRAVYPSVPLSLLPKRDLIDLMKKLEIS